MSADAAHTPTPHDPSPSATTETVLPLRGLASEGIGPLVIETLGALPGVSSVEVHPVEAFVRVVHDTAVTSADALRERLATVGRSPSGDGGVPR